MAAVSRWTVDGAEETTLLEQEGKYNRVGIGISSADF